MHAFTALMLLATAPAAAAQQLPDKAETNDRFGAATASGDFNGDGFTDLAIGVPGESVVVHGFPLSPSFTNAGAVHVLYGGPGTLSSPGLKASGSQFILQPPAISGTLGVGSGHAFGSALASGDFNRDGFADLAIGIPGQKIGTQMAAGAVQIIPGTSSGLNPHQFMVFSQDTPLVHDVAESLDQFGASLAVGDFEGDGFDDLAIGAPGESLGQATRAGVVHVVRGSPTGILINKKISIWSQGSALADLAEPGDEFGRALAAGDLNGDGFDDLAIGVPAEGLGAGKEGALHVILGTSLGLSAAGNQFLHQDALDVEGSCEALDAFATALCIADFTDDGFDDLAVGIPQESTNGIRGGGVHMFFGSSAGPSTANDQVVTEDTFIVYEDVGPNDRFGTQLCTWRLDNANGRPLLTVAVPGEPIGQIPAAGAIHGLGFDVAGQVGYSLFTSAEFVPSLGPPTSECGLGLSLASGDFNADGRGDLAVGSPLRNRAQAQSAGEVCVIYPTFIVSDRWHQGP